MKLIPHLLGIFACAVILFVAYPTGSYHERQSFYAATAASSYILYSSLALAVTQIGRTRKTKAWTFFAAGWVAIVTYIPATRYVVELFYTEPPRWADSSLSVFRELYFWSPIIVGSLCIYRAIAMWADESLAQQQPDKAR